MLVALAAEWGDSVGDVTVIYTSATKEPIYIRPTNLNVKNDFAVSTAHQLSGIMNHNKKIPSSYPGAL
jgi:hypothetical protein